jgi:hypothetical protein
MRTWIASMLERLCSKHSQCTIPNRDMHTNKSETPTALINLPRSVSHTPSQTSSPCTSLRLAPPRYSEPMCTQSRVIPSCITADHSRIRTKPKTGNGRRKYMLPNANLLLRSVNFPFRVCWTARCGLLGIALSISVLTYIFWVLRRGEGACTGA